MNDIFIRKDKKMNTELTIKETQEAAFVVLKN